MFEKEETTVIPKERIVKEVEVYEEKAAGFWIRFWAFLIDTLVISAIIGIVVNPIFHLMDWSFDESVWYRPIVILSAIVYYAYFILLTKLWSQTVGKMIFGLRVKKDNGKPMDWLSVLFREGIGRFISNTFFKLPYLIVVFTPNHKAIQDFVADTTVVHEEVFSKKKVLTQEISDTNIVSTPSI
ncbi:RDD family protein [Lysinibacillus sp. 3P01SB]|uniref:RDD family protein n=1 Tax=Lysinibacillus sp. 3P01SB TaxID=3132284 RepID=UPI0039A7703F